MRRTLILYSTLAFSLAWSAITTAQNPAGSPPPTYGQTILSTYDARFIRRSQLIVTLIVPSGDLQAFFHWPTPSSLEIRPPSP